MRRSFQANATSPNRPVNANAMVLGSGINVISSMYIVIGVASRVRANPCIDCAPAGAVAVTESGIHVFGGLVESTLFPTSALPGDVSTVPRLLPVPLGPLKYVI